MGEIKKLSREIKKKQKALGFTKGKYSMPEFFKKWLSSLSLAQKSEILIYLEENKRVKVVCEVRDVVGLKEVREWEYSQIPPEYRHLLERIEKQMAKEFPL